MSIVNINLIDIFGTAVSCDVIFKPQDTPFISGSVLTVSGNQSVRLDSTGIGSVSLQPGRYTVTFSGITSNSDAIYVSVPAGDGSYAFTSLIGWGAGVVNLAPGNMLAGNNLADVADPSTAFQNIKQPASETSAGVMQIASQAEVDAGTDGSKSITPSTLANAAKWAEKADATHTHLAAQISDATDAGRALLTAPTAQAQRDALQIPPPPVASVAGKTGDVTLAPADVGLSNVPNINATNASNLASGTVPESRGGAGTIRGLLKADGGGNVSQAISGTDFLAPDLPDAVYLAATWFSNETKLRLAVSADATNWSFIGGTSLYSGPTDTCRDMSIRRLNDGFWYMVYGAENSGNGSLAYLAKSSDLLNWTDAGTIDFAAVGNVTDTYAPQWFQDPDDPGYTGLHVIASVSTAGTGYNGPFHMYETHPLDATLTTWSEPVQITGTNLPSNMIDGAIYRIDSTYYFWYKRQDDNIGYIELATSNNLTSGYTVASQNTNDWLGIGTQCEAPGLVELGGGKFRLFFDTYANPRLWVRYVDFSNGLQSAPGPVTDVVTPVKFRHCDVVRITDVNVIRQVMAAKWVASGSLLSGQLAVGDYATANESPDGVSHIELYGNGSNYPTIRFRGNAARMIVLDKEGHGVDTWLTRAASGGTDIARFLGGTNNVEWFGNQQVDGTLTVGGASGVAVKRWKHGVANLTGGTVTVADSTITANSRIFLTAQDSNTSGALRISTRAAGASFTITSSNAADSGSVAYQILEP
jgi:hypothetical protein